MSSYPHTTNTSLNHTNTNTSLNHTNTNTSLNHTNTNASLNHTNTNTSLNHTNTNTSLNHTNTNTITLNNTNLTTLNPTYTNTTTLNTTSLYPTNTTSLYPTNTTSLYPTNTTSLYPTNTTSLYPTNTTSLYPTNTTSLNNTNLTTLNNTNITLNPTNTNTTTLNNTTNILTTLNNSNNNNNNTPACAACKHQRRKCTQNCMLSRYFPATQTSNFLNSHKLFGVKKISNMLQAIPESQRAIAAQTIIVEGNARANDPVRGCVGIISDLTRQIESYRAELELVNTHLAGFKAQENGFVSNNSHLDGYKAQANGFVNNNGFAGNSNGVINGHLVGNRVQENGIVSYGVTNNSNGFVGNNNGFVGNNNGFVGNNNGYEHGGQMMMDMEFDDLLGENNNNGGLHFRNQIGMKDNDELGQEAYEEKQLKVGASVDFSIPADFVNEAEVNKRSVNRPPQVIPPFGTRVRSSTQNLQAGQAENIPAPFLWATTKRANIYSLEQLQLKDISTINGQMQCKKCENQFDMQYNLQEKFYEVESFIRGNKYEMRDRAPSVWTNPVLPSCRFCGKENCVKPVISNSKKTMNWLFLFLGQMLGCLTLAQLKYFCKHNGIHRTGAKDRLLYLTYMCLCTQLSPRKVDQDGRPPQ